MNFIAALKDHKYGCFRVKESYAIASADVARARLIDVVGDDRERAQDGRWEAVIPRWPWLTIDIFGNVMDISCLMNKPHYRWQVRR